MTRIKEVKAARKKKQKLLLTIRIMQMLAFVLMIACGFKAFFLALVQPYSTPSVIGAVLAMAAMAIMIVLGKLFDEVKEGKQ